MKFRRWLSSEAVHTSIAVASAPTMVYPCNVFMNAVDIVDHLCVSNPVARREHCVPMTLFTSVLDATVNSAYALSKEMALPGYEMKMAFRESSVVLLKHLPFCFSILGTCAAQFVTMRCCFKGRRDRWRARNLTAHSLIKTDGTQNARCQPCRLPVAEKRIHTIFVHCSARFHISFFVAFHHRKKLASANPTLSEIANKAFQNSTTQGRHVRGFHKGVDINIMKPTFWFAVHSAPYTCFKLKTAQAKVTAPELRHKFDLYRQTQGTHSGGRKFNCYEWTAMYDVKQTDRGRAEK